MFEHILTGPKIHYSGLPPARPDDENAVAWETYRREVARLLAEGHEGKYVLIHKNEIVGCYDTFQAAKREGSLRYFVQREPYLIRQILTYERTVRTRLAG